MPAPEESYELDRDCPRCWHCDDMGDVTRADGEWLGICSCAAGDRLRAETEYLSWLPIKAAGAAPSQAPSDAQDAARYRWLTKYANIGECFTDAGTILEVHGCDRQVPDGYLWKQVDEAIDAAMGVDYAPGVRASDGEGCCTDTPPPSREKGEGEK
jgi:hypothetical protein